MRHSPRLAFLLLALIGTTAASVSKAVAPDQHECVFQLVPAGQQASVAVFGSGAPGCEEVKDVKVEFKLGFDKEALFPTGEQWVRALPSSGSVQQEGQARVCVSNFGSDCTVHFLAPAAALLPGQDHAR